MSSRRFGLMSTLRLAPIEVPVGPSEPPFLSLCKNAFDGRSGPSPIGVHLSAPSIPGIRDITLRSPMGIREGRALGSVPRHVIAEFPFDFIVEPSGSYPCADPDAVLAFNGFIARHVHVALDDDMMVVPDAACARLLAMVTTSLFPKPGVRVSFFPSSPIQDPEKVKPSVFVLPGLRLGKQRIISTAFPALIRLGANRDPTEAGQLMAAVVAGDIDGIVDALWSGSSVEEGLGHCEPRHVEDTCGGSALVVAAARGDLDVVRVLLGAGADPTARDCLYKCALYFAASSGNAGIARLLLQCSRINPNVADIYGNTPFQGAAWAGHTDVVAAFLEHPLTDPNVCSRDGGDSPPLHCALHQGHLPVVQLLIADPRTDTSAGITGRSALEVAQDAGNEEAIALLTAHEERVRRAPPAKQPRRALQVGPGGARTISPCTVGVAYLVFLYRMRHAPRPLQRPSTSWPSTREMRLLQPWGSRRSLA